MSRLLRRGTGVALLASALVVLSGGRAAAHGFGGRLDLPVPKWLFVYGAAAALIVSFVALAVLWREPRLEGRRGRRGNDGLLQALAQSPAVEWSIRLLALAAFLLVTGAALAGNAEPFDNIAPVVVYVWFWVGLAFAHALLGNLWATLSPFDTLARLLDLGREPRRAYPVAWGAWPAVALLFGFVWLELVLPTGDAPRTLGTAIVVYTLLTLAGMAAFGRDTWNRRGEAFAVYFDLLSRIAPLTRDEEGRIVRRPVLGGLPALTPVPGLLALVLVALGSTTFDGFTRTSMWASLSGDLSGASLTLAGTIGLLAVIGVVSLAYALAMAAAARVVEGSWHATAIRFAHSLVPIAFAYVVAHYVSLLLIEGQIGLRLVSDPFGSGMNLLGTADWIVNLAVVSATTIWYVQVAAIVAGHIGGVVLAHDRAVAAYPPGRALSTQYALLAVMILYTASGLLILSG